MTALDTACADVISALGRVLDALGQRGDVADAARQAEDALEGLQRQMEQELGLGLIADWTAPGQRPPGPVSTVRLAFDVHREEARDDILSLVDDRLCQTMDEDRFAILSTTRLTPGARGSAGDPHADVDRAAHVPTQEVQMPPGDHGHLPTRDDVAAGLASLLRAAGKFNGRPRAWRVRRFYGRQDAFEAQLLTLHDAVFHRAAAPLVTTWAYEYGQIPWRGPLVLRAAFDVADGVSDEELLAEVHRVIRALDTNDFTLAAAHLVEG